MADYIYSNSSGTILADTSAIQTAVTAEYKRFLGLGDTDSIDASSTEGRMIEAEISSRVATARAIAYQMNQINPDFADGVHFDSIYMLMGGERDAAEQSTCDCVLTGIIGTIITAGALVKDDNGEQWVLASDVTIGSNNTVTGSFRSVNYGAINADIGEINQINTGVLGWETVNNEVAATAGKTQQSLINAKQQRKIEIGANGRAPSYATIAAVSQLDGVASLSFRENRKHTTEVIDNITMPPHSSWLCVDGGVTDEIVEQYVINTWGTGFVGEHNTVTGIYTDEISGQVLTVNIDRPDDVPLKISITAKLSGAATGADDIKDAVLAYANGDIDGANGFTLGNPISTFEIAWAVNNYLSASNVYITKCEATTVVDDTLSSDTIEVELWEKGSIAVGNIEVILI